MKPALCRAFVSTWILALAILPSASQAAATQRIEAFGDSITAGFLSYTDVTHPPPLGGADGVSSIITDLANFLLTGDQSLMRKHHRPEAAWPALLSQVIPGGPVPVDNFAISGARVADLESQVGRAGTPTETTIAFFFIGHNDLCNNLAEPEAIGQYFAERYRAALTQWEAKHSGATAYLMPVGDIPRVFRTLQNHKWHQNGGRAYRCEDSWERFFPYCPSHSRRLKAGTLDDYLTPRIREINRTLSRVSEELARASTKNRYRYADTVLTRPFEPRFFAIDCYHLSPTGQEEVMRDVADFIRKQ